jgi:predicted lipoprotein with Yx(FWY)xxD motif
MNSNRLTDLCKAAAVAAVVASLSGPAQAEPKVLTDKAGMTVYTFDEDSNGGSNCGGDCAAAWPPVTEARMPIGSDFSAVSRDDGTRQAAYRGKPLYLFAGDRKPGDVKGDNIQGVWHVVPMGSAPKAAQSNPAATPGYSYGY